MASYEELIKIYPKEQIALNPQLLEPSFVLPNSAITSQDTIPTTSIDFQTPRSTPIFPISGLDSSFQTQPTTSEIQTSDLTTRLQKLNEQLLGQSTFRTEQEQVQGIPELQKTQSDLSARLKQLQNEALAIPLQLQQESIGRGITAGGLRPLETAALRTNAIQALSTASLLEASRGNLTTALDLVDRAVSQKYDPIKEEIAVKQANLDLILKSPTYSLEERNRAQIQKEAQERRSRSIAQQERYEKEIMNIAIDAVQNGADTLTLRQIQNAETPSQALQIAAPFLRKEEKVKSIRQAISETAFTDTQINKGAATADIPISDFQKLDVDTQNFFINNSDQIKAKKKIIDDARIAKEDPSSIEKEINESSLPNAVKDSLVRYLKQSFPKIDESSQPWWKRILGVIGF